MCLTPIIVDNPNYRSSSELIRRLKNTTDSKIEVPCGHCSVCRSRKQSDILQRVQMEAQRSYVYMFTLTYNQESVPKFMSMVDTHETIYRPYFKHITDMFKRIRTTGYFGDRQFKHLVCCEYTTTARPHYHGLLFIEKKPTDHRFEYLNLERLAYDTLLLEWRENIATTIAKRDTKRYKKGSVIKNTRKPVYRSLCTFVQSYRGRQLRSTYDLHYVHPMASNGENDVAYYVSKYLFKDSTAVKYIQKCCYLNYQPSDSSDLDQVEAAKRSAMDLYREIFRTTYRMSPNFGNLWTNESYKKFRSDPALNKIGLEYTKDAYNELKMLARSARANNTPVRFFDLYTGKSMPINNFYLRNLPLVDQIYHFEQTQKIDKLRPVDSRKQSQYSRKLHEYDRKTERFVISDLFDDISTS